MPGHAYHTRKKKHDFEASKLIHDSSPSAFADWEIVTLFYSALHYVDCYLDRAHSMHPNGHGDRKDYIIDLLPVIERDYRLLRALSEDARYHDVSVQQPELTRATRFYDQIKHCLTPVTCAGCGQENLINKGKCEVCEVPL